MVGYKQKLEKFYVEPQIGYGEYGGKIKFSGDYARPSVGAFFWAVGAGYDFKRIDIGIRYQSVHGAEGTSAGVWHNKGFHHTGFYIGYTIIETR